MEELWFQNSDIRESLPLLERYEIISSKKKQIFLFLFTVLESFPPRTERRRAGQLLVGQSYIFNVQVMARSLLTSAFGPPCLLLELKDRTTSIVLLQSHCANRWWCPTWRAELLIAPFRCMVAWVCVRTHSWLKRTRICAPCASQTDRTKFTYEASQSTSIDVTIGSPLVSRNTWRFRMERVWPLRLARGTMCKTRYLVA